MRTLHRVYNSTKVLKTRQDEIRVLERLLEKHLTAVNPAIKRKRFYFYEINVAAEANILARCIGK